MSRATPSAVFRSLGLAALAAASISLAACGGGGHSRGMFTGKVMGKTEVEIIDQYGQPAAIERIDADNAILVYKAKTFDPDNENRTDPETAIHLAKGKDGRVIASDVSYRG